MCKLKAIVFAVSLALMSFSVFSAGLGELKIRSNLGEPLNAEVELLSVTPEELSTLVASIASEKDYVAQGIPRLGIHSDIKVNLAKNTDGLLVLKLSSSQAISDSYLDMLIQVDWAAGRLQREYTVLFDVPGLPQRSENAVDVPVKLPSVSLPSQNVISSNSQDNNPSNNALADSIKADSTSVKAAETSSKPAAQTSSSRNKVADATVRQTLITKPGDTLTLIARQWQDEGVSLDQMLVGLYENNQDAFIDGNMNHLKVGKIIKMPTQESLLTISPQEATKSVKVHSANWNTYRNNLAEAVSAASAMLESEQKQSTSGKISTAEVNAAPVISGSQDVVKLSSGEKEAGVAGKGASKGLDAEIVALQEEATARENALKKAQSRTANLEKQIADMRKLLALKSQSMAVLQKGAEANAKAAQAKPSALESLMNSVDLLMLAGATAAVLLGACWIFIRNKRRKNLGSFERGIVTTNEVANTVIGNTTGDIGISEASFSTDLAQNADGSVIKANDIEPISLDLDLAIDEASQAPFVQTAETPEPPLPLSAQTSITGEMATAVREELAANTIDLSTISLDMDSVQPEFPEVSLGSDTTPTADADTEPQGINIKARFSGDLY